MREEWMKQIIPKAWHRAGVPKKEGFLKHQPISAHQSPQCGRPEPASVIARRLTSYLVKNKLGDTLI